MRPAPHAPVQDHVDRIAKDGMALSAVTVWDIHNGIRLLNPGRRRDDLSGRFTALLGSLFRDRIIAWDEVAAIACADIMETKRRAGRPLDDHVPDAMIAATALCRDLILVTRNGREFADLKISVENPWRP